MMGFMKCNSVLLVSFAEAPLTGTATAAIKQPNIEHLDNNRRFFKSLMFAICLVNGGETLNDQGRTHTYVSTCGEIRKSSAEDLVTKQRKARVDVRRLGWKIASP